MESTPNPVPTSRVGRWSVHEGRRAIDPRLLPDRTQRSLVDLGLGSEILVRADGAEVAVFVDRIVLPFAVPRGAQVGGTFTSY